MTLKKAISTSSILAAALWVTLVGGCGGTQQSQEGSHPNLQGDNLNAGDSRSGGGETSEPGPDEQWVTLCHIPPGNPARAHTITVGQPAVKAHLNHGDILGACKGDTDAGSPDQDGGTWEPDAGDPGPQPDAGSGQPDAGTGEPDAGSEEPDAGSACMPAGNACGTNLSCCDGLKCTEGVCVPIFG